MEARDYRPAVALLDVAGRGLFVDGRAQHREQRGGVRRVARRARGVDVRADLVEQRLQVPAVAEVLGRERARKRRPAQVRGDRLENVVCLGRREGEGSHFLGLDGTAARR